jgi:hypothetical protein
LEHVDNVLSVGIQPHQNIATMAKITEASKGAYQGKEYATDMLLK